MGRPYRLTRRWGPTCDLLSRPVAAGHRLDLILQRNSFLKSSAVPNDFGVFYWWKPEAVVDPAVHESNRGHLLRPSASPNERGRGPSGHILIAGRRAVIGEARAWTEPAQIGFYPDAPK